MPHEAALHREIHKIVLICVGFYRHLIIHFHLGNWDRLANWVNRFRIGLYISTHAAPIRELHRRPRAVVILVAWLRKDMTRRHEITDSHYWPNGDMVMTKKQPSRMCNCPADLACIYCVFNGALKWNRLLGVCFFFLENYLCWQNCRRLFVYNWYTVAVSIAYQKNTRYYAIYAILWVT